MGLFFRCLAVCCFIFLSVGARAENFTEDQVLQAVFVAFQPVDIFTEKEVILSREVLFVAAAEGNELAIKMLDSIQSFAGFFDSPPKKAVVPLIEKILGANKDVGL